MIQNIRNWLKNDATKKYWYWKKSRQYRYKNWGYKYTAWFYMKWYKTLMATLCLVFCLFVTGKTYADTPQVSSVRYQSSNENVEHSGACASSIFQIIRASDAAVMTDGVVGCTGSNPAIEVVAPSDVLIGSFPYGGDYYVKIDGISSNVFTLVSGDYTASPTPTATPSATPIFTYIDIASSSAFSYGVNAIVQMIYNMGLILIVCAAFGVGIVVYRL